jgi:signal transduction histidine kinase
LHHQRPDLRFRVRLDDDPAIVRADPVFLDRVLANLLDNAAKTAISDARNEVEVEARRSDDEITVRVIDHGEGVPESAHEQLFYPFYQVHERHPRLGTGLGLAIAKGFLALMSGKIWIEETPGGGATFAFSLPTNTAAPMP